MYVYSYIMARSRLRYCHGKERLLSCLIVAGLYLAVNDTLVFNFDTEMRQWVHFALLSSHQIFHTAIKNTRLLISP